MPTHTARRSSSSSDTLDSPRVRFNWGFHDATADEIAGRPVRDMLSGHFCPPYAAGYRVGRATMARLITEAATAGVSAERPQSSEPAWLEHVASTAT